MQWDELWGPSISNHSIHHSVTVSEQHCCISRQCSWKFSCFPPSLFLIAVEMLISDVTVTMERRMKGAGNPAGKGAVQSCHPAPQGCSSHQGIPQCPRTPWPWKNPRGSRVSVSPLFFSKKNARKLPFCSSGEVYLLQDSFL